MISKIYYNVISNVLNCDIKAIDTNDTDSSVKSNEIAYFLAHDSEGYSFLKAHFEDSINIHELSHRCKEWAVSLKPNKHALSSYPLWGNKRDYPDTNGHYYICKHLATGSQFEAETELEAILKACSFILDKQNNKERS